VVVAKGTNCVRLQSFSWPSKTDVGRYELKNDKHLRGEQRRDESSRDLLSLSFQGCELEHKREVIVNCLSLVLNEAHISRLPTSTTGILRSASVADPTRDPGFH
jgi:hypothetical protein